MSQANKINGALVLHLIYSSSLTVAVVCRPKCAHQRNICHGKLICHVPLGKGNDVRHYNDVQHSHTSPAYYTTIQPKDALPRLRHYVLSGQGCTTKATTLCSVRSRQHYQGYGTIFSQVKVHYQGYDTIFSLVKAALPRLRHYIQSGQGCTTKAMTLYSVRPRLHYRSYDTIQSTNAARPKLRHFHD